jgi:hypothetical protein
VLWTAGQARIARESRERLVELYVGVRDGSVAGEATLGRAKWKGGFQAPAYVRSAQKAEPVRRSPAIRDRALAELGAMFPGIVRRGDS